MYDSYEMIEAKPALCHCIVELKPRLLEMSPLQGGVQLLIRV